MLMTLVRGDISLSMLVILVGLSTPVFVRLGAIFSNLDSFEGFAEVLADISAMDFVTTEVSLAS